MPRRSSPTAPPTPHPNDRPRALWRAPARTAVLALLLALALASSAHAGSYVIDNCPAAPAGNANAGAWTIFGSPQADQATCAGGAGAFIGPLGGSMTPNTSAGVTITAPGGSGITIRQATVWWYVPQASGATTFAVAETNGGVVGGGTTPLDDISTPEELTLPSTTTSFTLTDYCSSDDGPTGCTFGAGENPILELLGSQLTLEDANLPSGSVTGGALAGTGTLSGTQALAYSVADANSGVRLVKLLLDGSQVAEKDYLERCPYEDFLACPASISDTISWNTATVPDGQHSLEAIVQDAAQNTSVFYTATITTNNAPTNTTAPAIVATSQPVAGTALSAQPGSWSAPTGAGAITYSYQWQDCNSEAGDCQAIPGAQSPSYTPAASDLGHTLRVTVTAADNDGQSTATSTPSGVVLSASGSLGTLPGPGTSPTSGVGAPNGTPAAETALITLDGSHTISRSFAKRAFTLTGRLTASQDNPISGATLEVLQQIAGTSTLTLIKHATTNAAGAFTVAIPAGPSRRIEIAYRAYTGDPGYTATASVAETVQAGVQLHVTTIVGGPNGTIVLSGHVSGPIPHQGALVQILVHWRGYWELIRNPRTNRQGTFHAAYQFQGDIGRFPFWAEVPSGQASFPYTVGYSNIVNVATG